MAAVLLGLPSYRVIFAFGAVLQAELNTAYNVLRHNVKWEPGLIIR